MRLGYMEGGSPEEEGNGETHLDDVDEGPQSSEQVENLFGIGSGSGVSPMPRLNEFGTNQRFSRINPKLRVFDDCIREFYYNSLLIRRYWGLEEILIIATASFGFLLGSWDIGIGELSGGGDYNRWGFLGEESGFLHIRDLSLIVSLLSVLCWLAFVGQIWAGYPIMRENLAYLLVGSLFVQLGLIRAHANSPYFPLDSGIPDWIWVIVVNFVMLFLSIFVVHRAVIETRDVHVRIAHSHPDPRIIEREWGDHSLMAWGFGIGIWIILVNLNAWLGSHSIAPSPGELDFSYFLIFLYFVSGVVSSALLLFLIWYPQLMLGGSKQKIMSSRAREIEGGAVKAVAVEMGTCPVCNHNTRTTRDSKGGLQAPCPKEGCTGKGSPGSNCEKCEAVISTRMVCENCQSNTHIANHFGKADAW